MATPRPSEEQWDWLTTAIELAEKLQVVFVACTDVAVEEALRERLRHFCEQTGRPMCAPAPDQYVLDWLFDVQQDPPPSAPDGEHSPVLFLPLPKKKELFVLHRLNENRDNLRCDLRGVLCIVGDKSLPRVVPYEAPDLWDVRVKLLELDTLTPPEALLLSTGPAADPAAVDLGNLRDVSPHPIAVPTPAVTAPPGKRTLDQRVAVGAPLFLIGAITLGLIALLADNLLIQECNGTASSPPDTQSNSHNLCSDIKDGRCSVSDDRVSVSGRCEHQQMVGEWKAVASYGVQPFLWKGSYCKGKPCGKFYMNDNVHGSVIEYDADGQPVGTWTTWSREAGRWIAGQGRMNRDGKQETWTYFLDSLEVVAKGRYLNDKRIGRWEYTCNNGNRMVVDDPEGPNMKVSIEGPDGTKLTDQDRNSLCPRLK